MIIGSFFKIESYGKMAKKLFRRIRHCDWNKRLSNEERNTQRAKVRK